MEVPYRFPSIGFSQKTRVAPTRDAQALTGQGGATIGPKPEMEPMNTNTTNATNPANITTIESLVAEANRRGFRIQGGFMPATLIPMVEARIQQHNAADHGLTETSGDYIEWKQTRDDLQQFLALLRTLPARLPYENAVHPPQNTSTARQKIEQLKKDIDERLARLPAALQQQLTSVPAPFDQASGARPTPVCDPSADAPHASATPPGNTGAPSSNSKPSIQTNPTAKPSPTREEYILLNENPSRSPIDDFPAERQQILYALLYEYTYVFVAKLLAQPEPVGWNFQTSDTSLKRFKKRYRKKLEAAERAEAFAEAHSTIQQTGPDEQTYMDAARRLLKIRLYKNAADPESSGEQLELLIRLLDRQRRTDLAERRVKLAEQSA